MAIPDQHEQSNNSGEYQNVGYLGDVNYIQNDNNNHNSTNQRIPIDYEEYVEIESMIQSTKNGNAKFGGIVDKDI